jgi:hypothetical protein
MSTNDAQPPSDSTEANKAAGGDCPSASCSRLWEPVAVGVTIVLIVVASPLLLIGWILGRLIPEGKDGDSCGPFFGGWHCDKLRRETSRPCRDCPKFLSENV